MQRLAAALPVLTLLLAGCSGGGGPSPEQVAEDAIERLHEDEGPDGDLESAELDLDVDIAGDAEVAIDASGSMTLYAGQAGRVTMEFDSVQIDGEAMPDLEAFWFILQCDPGEIFVQVSGNADWGGSDGAWVTGNDAGACFGDGVDEEGIASSLERIVPHVGPGMAEGLLTSFLQPTPDEEYEVLSAEKRGSRIHATYEATDEDGTHEEEAVIEDGRIVEQSIESEEDGIRTAMELRYEYGARGTAPAVEGAMEV